METFVKILKLIALIVGAILVYGFSFYIGWNGLLRDVFEISPLTYKDCVKVGLAMMLIIGPFFTNKYLK